MLKDEIENKRMEEKKKRKKSYFLHCSYEQ
jgi:hypothetical protein